MADEPTALIDLVDDGPVPVGEIVHQPIEVELGGGLSQYIVVTASGKELLDSYLQDTVVAFEAVESAAPSPDDVDVAQLIDEHLMTGAGEAGEFVVVRFMPSPGVGELDVNVTMAMGFGRSHRYYVTAKKSKIAVTFSCTGGEIKFTISKCQSTAPTKPYVSGCEKPAAKTIKLTKGSANIDYKSDVETFWGMDLEGLTPSNQYNLSGTFKYSDYKTI